MEPGARIESFKDSQPLVEAHAAIQGGKQGNNHSSHSIYDPKASFFTYRDYYVPDLGVKANRGADHEVTISLQQKFVVSS